MVRVVLIACALAGCFKPSYDHPACGPNRECPSGFACNAQDVCERPGGGDASVPEDGAPHDSMFDAPPTDAMFCMGSAASLFRPCFDTMPGAPVSFSGNVTIDTNAGSSRCDPSSSNAEVCVVAGSTITFSTGSHLIGRGTRALMFVAVTAINVDGVVDVSAHLAAPASGNALGPCDIGARPTAGTGGGGAGGSFVQRGGLGGTANASEGTPGTIVGAVTSLRGGCVGQAGATGSGAGVAIGGAGGGAVYLMAGTTITIIGSVHAGGAGGVGGASAERAGGGGGGSGGLIGLDAPAVNIGSIGIVVANGGAGGEGSAGQAPQGGAGGDAFDNLPARGGNGQNSGGDGGNGGFGSTAPNAGLPPGGGGGAGGGGGGAGLIRVIPLGALTVTSGGFVMPVAQ